VNRESEAGIAATPQDHPFFVIRTIGPGDLIAIFIASP